jgi:Flp pilus assembly protein TadG
MKKKPIHSAERGAAMVEAVFVLPIFICFFLGMLYFESLYHTKLRVMQLARAGAVSYAMDACTDTDPLQTIKKDLAGAKDGDANGNPSSKQQTEQGSIDTTNNAKVGNDGNKPVGQALQDQGFVGDPTSQINVTGVSQASMPRTALDMSIASSSYMSCSDKQKAGDFKGMVDLITHAFPHH